MAIGDIQGYIKYCNHNNGYWKYALKIAIVIIPTWATHQKFLIVLQKWRVTIWTWKCFVWQIYVDSAQAGDSPLIDTHVWGFGRLRPQCENPCRQRWERKKTTPSSSSYVSSSSYFFLFLIHYVCFLNPHLLAKTFTSSSCFAKMPSSAVGSDLAFDILSEMWMKPTKSPRLLQMDLGRYNQISKFKWRKGFFTNTQMKWSREDSLDPSFKLRNEHEKFFYI